MIPAMAKPPQALVALTEAPESFFSLLKTERIKTRIYKTRNEARADVFNYIELFYNPVRRHGNNNGLPPAKFEEQYFMKLSGV